MIDHINFSSYWIYTSIILTCLSLVIWILLIKSIKNQKDISEKFQYFFLSFFLSLGEFYTYQKSLKDQPHIPIWGFVPSIVIPLLLFYTSIISSLISIIHSFISGFFTPQFFQEFIGVHFYIVLIYLSFALAHSSLIGIFLSILQLITAFIKAKANLNVQTQVSYSKKHE